MAGSPILAGTPTMPVTGVTQDPSVTRNPDISAAVASFGRHGQLHTAEIHGRWYSAAARSNLFVSSTLIAGVTVPAPATTLASKAGMRNPVGSGVNVELVSIGLTAVTIDVALKNFLMEFQINASATGGVPTSITDLTAYAFPLSTGNKTSAAKAYSAATMTNAAANPILIPLVPKIETAVGAAQPVYFKFDGEIVFGPDTVMAITCTAALAAVNLSYIWAEWPI